jgi:hypothetical protein
MAHEDPKFNDAMKRVMPLFDGYTKGTKHSSKSITVTIETAMVELVVQNVRNGDLRPPSFLQHPAHLPEGNELKLLMASTASKDSQLRGDAIAWSVTNRTEADRASVSLRNAITALRMIDDLVADPNLDSDTGEVLHEWRHEVEAYLRATFACDPREAPTGRDELDAWCLRICDRANPTPRWLRTWRGHALAYSSADEDDTIAGQFARFMAAKNGDDE